MNKVILMGRLVANPEVRYSADSTAIARYTLAVDRRTKDGGADFIPCVAFTNNAEFAEKYLAKGTKVVIVGRIQTGNYTNKDGQKVYTTDVVIESQEFAENKKDSNASANGSNADDGFKQFGGFPVEVEDDDLPFAKPSR